MIEAGGASSPRQSLPSAAFFFAAAFVVVVIVVVVAVGPVPPTDIVNNTNNQTHVWKTDYAKTNNRVPNANADKKTLVIQTHVCHPLHIKAILVEANTEPLEVAIP
jgi:hypothetical protein